MLVSLYTSRVILNTLGVEDYGTYAIVGGVVSMLGFFNGAMATATQRFLSFELGQKDYVQLRKIFNATQIIHIGIAFLVFVLAETVGLWIVNNYLKIPEGRMEAALWVYHFSILSFMVSIVQVPYNAVIIARERMNVYAYVSILEVLLKLFIVFILNWLTYDKLQLYGILHFMVVFVVAAIYRIYTRKKFEETKFEIVKEINIYKTLVSYSGWNLFGNLAGVAKFQGVGIILNMFFGTIANAAQGVANQIYAAINSFVSNFQLASNPQIIKSYSSDEKEYMFNLVIRTSKFSFYLMFMLTLPIVLEIDYILTLWLKIVPEYTAIFSSLILINALIDSISGPIITSLHATGVIKKYQIIVGTLLILILPVSFIFFKLGFPPATTFVISISFSVFAFFIRLILLKKQIHGFPIRKLLYEVVLKNIIIVAIVVSLTLLVYLNMESGILRLMIIVIYTLVLNVLIMYKIGLNNLEKNFINIEVKNRFKNFNLRNNNDR